MALERKDLDAIFGATLKPELKKKGSNWYLHSPEVITVLNIQRSSFSKSYYINIGIFFTALDASIAFPKEDESHLRMRIDALGRDVITIDRALDFENPNMADSDREQTISETLLKAKQ